MTTHIGERWGNYQLVRLLGQGGFAQVYLGEHVRLGMRAAIKILYSRLTGESITSFQREAKTIAELAHPHIVRVLDFDVHQGMPFLVLEYAPNGSLRQKHPYRERVPLAQVVDYVQHVASALQYAHDGKLIHRDVKPENMLLNGQGQVVLSDFGIATLAHSTSSIQTQETTGTLAYMAPEQIQGKPRPASDQYALGITVYQWLTGAFPFQGSSTELIAQHLAMAPPSLRQKVPDLPSEVEQAVLTALQKKPQERFDSVQAFANALTIASVLAPHATFLSPAVPSAQPVGPALGVVLPPFPGQGSSVSLSTLQPDHGAPTEGILTTPEPLPDRKPSAAGPKRKARTWLLIAFVGILTATLIPAVIFWPRAPAHIKTCQVGTGLDTTRLTIQGASDHFSASVPQLYLVCQLAPGSDHDQITDDITFYPGGGSQTSPILVAAPQGYFRVFYGAGNLAGSYTWHVYYSGSEELSVNFRLT